MCELFAVNAKQSVHVNTYLNEFFSHSIDNPHGWGMSWREGSVYADPTLYKEELRAVDSKKLKALLEDPIVVKRMLAHIRKSTAGAISYENCHPFVGEDMTGRIWTFAHNGILFNEELLGMYADKEEGETDSERTLLFLLDVLNEAAMRRGGELTFEDRFDALAGALSQITNLNRLNLLIDDGEYTFVHTNTNVDTLHFVDMGDGELVFSTHPLASVADPKKWQPVPKNRLIAYKDGKLVKTSAPHGYTFCEAILDMRRRFGDRWMEEVA